MLPLLFTELLAVSLDAEPSVVATWESVTGAVTLPSPATPCEPLATSLPLPIVSPGALATALPLPAALPSPSALPLPVTLYSPAAAPVPTASPVPVVTVLPEMEPPAATEAVPLAVVLVVSVTVVLSNVLLTSSQEKDSPPWPQLYPLDMIARSLSVGGNFLARPGAGQDDR